MFFITKQARPLTDVSHYYRLTAVGRLVGSQRASPKEAKAKAHFHLRNCSSQYPHQTSTGQRELRAMETKSTSRAPVSKFQPQNKTDDRSSQSRPEPTLHDSQLSLDNAGEPSVKDFQQDLSKHLPQSSRPQSPSSTKSKPQQMTSIPSEPDFSDLEVVTPATERGETWKRGSHRAPSQSRLICC